MAINMKAAGRIIQEEYAGYEAHLIKYDTLRADRSPKGAYLQAIEAESDRIIDDMKRDIYTQLPTTNPTKEPDMTLVQGHRCNKCGKLKLTDPDKKGQRSASSDRYDPALPKGWLQIHSYPQPVTLCKKCQRKAGLR